MYNPIRSLILSEKRYLLHRIINVEQSRWSDIALLKNLIVPIRSFGMIFSFFRFFLFLKFLSFYSIARSKKSRCTRREALTLINLVINSLGFLRFLSYLRAPAFFSRFFSSWDNVERQQRVMDSAFFALSRRLICWTVKRFFFLLQIKKIRDKSVNF